MGDLADCSYFDENSDSTMSDSDYYWCINNSVDTTTKTTNCTYDRTIITNPTVSDLTGNPGVFRFNIKYELTMNETIAASDHYPVYVEFWCNRDTDSSSTTDAVIALQIAVGSRPFDPDFDMNVDGSITSIDALMILQLAVSAIEVRDKTRKGCEWNCETEHTDNGWTGFVCLLCGLVDR